LARVLQLLADPALRAQLDDGDLRSYTPFHVACAGALRCSAATVEHGSAGGVGSRGWTWRTFRLTIYGRGDDEWDGS
jgi:hypothetical protein